MKTEINNYEVHRFTGITALDAVISINYERALAENIAWNWKGFFILGEDREIFDICVLFSNLLSNAVEANERIEDDYMTVKAIDWYQILMALLGKA